MECSFCNFKTVLFYFVQGGYFCRFEFTPELLPELDSGHAAVGNLGTINLNKEGKHLVGYYIPRMYFNTNFHLFWILELMLDVSYKKMYML